MNNKLFIENYKRFIMSSVILRVSTILFFICIVNSIILLFVMPIYYGIALFILSLLVYNLLINKYGFIKVIGK